MKLTEKKLKELGACPEGIEWWKTLKTTSLRVSLETAVNAKKYSYVSWLLPRIMKKNEDRVKFSVYAARLVLDIFEKQCTGDNRPRLAIEAAEEWLKHKTKKNTYAAATYAASAASAAYATNATASAAAYAAYAAASAVYAYYAAANAAYYAASAAAYAANAAYSARKEIYRKLINYGLKLIGGKLK